MWERILDFITGGYKKAYDRCSENYTKAMQELALLSAELADAERENKQLKEQQDEQQRKSD